MLYCVCLCGVNVCVCAGHVVTCVYVCIVGRSGSEGEGEGKRMRNEFAYSLHTTPIAHT